MACLVATSGNTTAKYPAGGGASTMAHKYPHVVFFSLRIVPSQCVHGHSRDVNLEDLQTRRHVFGMYARRRCPVLPAQGWGPFL